MNIEITKQQGVTIVQIQGEIDLYNAPTLQKAIGEKIDEGEKKILIDLQECTYVDSSGLGCFISIMKRLATVKGAIKVANAKENITNLFKVARLTAMFGVYSSVDEAIAILSEVEETLSKR